jgi:hypothetical protein
MDEVFSFRWGIPFLDGGRTDIPNFMLDTYTQAGVSRSEFLAIVHLTRYQYESRDAECRPGVATVAEQMGYSVRGLQKILAGLEKRKLLVRLFRPGETTLYDFSGFSRTVLELSKGMDSGSGVNSSSPKEERTRSKAKEEKAAAGLSSAVFCSIHNVPMELRQKDSDKWYSHRLPDGGWCKGAPGDANAGQTTGNGVTVRAVCGRILPVGARCPGKDEDCCDECDLLIEEDE